MSFSLWLRNRTSTRPPRGPAQHRPAAPRFRPRLEALEGRWLPSTLTVTNNADRGPGSLRADIAAANSGDKIVFAPSLNGQTITLTSGELAISKNLTIQGPGASHLTISGDHLSRVFQVYGAQPVVLSGLTISNGVSHPGGGIINGGTLTVSQCTLSGNSTQGAGDGGGICNFGTLTVSQSTLNGNFALRGGGIYSSGFRKATLTNCTLSGNRTGSAAGSGGGLFVFSGTTTLTNCTISLNVSSSVGGGIAVATTFPPTLNLTNTIVAGNRFSSGSDITSGVTTMNYCLIGSIRQNVINGVGNIFGVNNPGLGPLQNNGGPTQTMALLPGSPAIGHANNSFAPATDQRGVTRLDTASETTDIGAFELTGTGSASTTTFSLAPLGTAPAARTPVNTVAASEATSGHVADENATVRLVPFKNGDRAVRGTLDAALKVAPSESNNQKTAALDELFAWRRASIDDAWNRFFG
jgi:hypothetical protein